MNPAPQRISPGSEGIPERRATQGYFKVPNSVAENLSLLTPAEKDLVIIVLRRGENTVSDQHWQDWTGKDPRMKKHAVQGLKEKGLCVRGRGDRAKYYFEPDRWSNWVRTRPRHERAKTAGRSKSVTAPAGMQIHQECRERGCQKMCGASEDTNSQVIPFPATNNVKQVSQTKVDPPPKVEPSPPPKGAWDLTLSAIRQYFPHVGPEFVDKLRVAIIQKGVRQYTDSQIAAAVHAARKDRRNQQTEGLFLYTVPEILAAVISTGAHLTHNQKRELRQAREVLANPSEWPEDAIEQARGILKKYGG